MRLKYKYAQIYSNQMSKFSEKDFRKQAFKIKSDLSNDYRKDEYLYIPVNLWRVITRTYTNYVIWNGYNVNFNNDTTDKRFTELSDELKLQILLNQAVDTQSYIWYSIVRVRTKDWKPRAELIPVMNYACDITWMSIWDSFIDIPEHFVFTVVKDDKIWRYFYVDRYVKEWENWRWYYWEKWSYTMNYVLTNQIEQAETEEVLDEFPLFIFNNDLTNSHTVTVDLLNDTIGDLPRYFNQSDYVDLADLLQELNDRESQISVEFIKNLTSRMSVPASYKWSTIANQLRQKKSEWTTDIPDWLTHNVGETPAQYITKDNSYVETGVNSYIPMILKLISSISSIPSAMLGNAVYGNSNPVGTTEKEYSMFYNRVSAKQLELYSELQRMFRYLMKLDGVNTDLPMIKFSRNTAWDILERTNIANTQMGMGIMSKESALAFTMWYDQDEIQMELKTIQDEQTEEFNKYKQEQIADENIEEESNNEWEVESNNNTAE